MKSIYDIINETKNADGVYNVIAPDGSICSVWTTEKEAKEDAERYNKEVKGKVFTVEKGEVKDVIKESCEL